MIKLSPIKLSPKEILEVLEALESRLVRIQESREAYHLDEERFVKSALKKFVKLQTSIIDELSEKEP